MQINIKIDKNTITNYIKCINSIDISMTKIKKELQNKKVPNELIPIKQMNKEIKTLKKTNKNQVAEEIITQIMNINNGVVQSKMLTPLNISRQYLSIMESQNKIQKLSRGIYISPKIYEDSYFTFQQKYRKIIFSHMNALYFYNLTEEFPSDYTVTVPQNYHEKQVNKNCHVFYVSDEIYKLGLTEIITPSGSKIKSYDKERSICDIIRSKGRMDYEQVTKTIKNYLNSEDKDLNKLLSYATKMNIKDQVIKMIGEVYYGQFSTINKR